ncbi:hypothetical protein SAMN04515647_1893 [Cohaesibacter sp. ES.047]|nr:hypothetical protein [Cohaesibacter sp. ES.047]SNY91665.1 hypothetical protein SAMN04515647_1893 [Cohaesibacter sp. ES.047]
MPSRPEISGLDTLIETILVLAMSLRLALARRNAGIFRYLRTPDIP